MQGTVNYLEINPQRQLQAKEFPLTDEQLVLEYRETGDRETFALLVYRYERELFNYLRRYLGNAELAEDVFQSTFMQVHLKCDQFEEGRRFRPWLYSIATNQAIDARRRGKRHQMLSLDDSRDHQNEEIGRYVNFLESGDSGPADGALDEERKQIIRDTLEQLPESLYSAVQLVYFQGMKYREAADVLDVPVGTVKSRVHAAITRLGEVWSGRQAE